jgi:hypothetical protein
MTFVGMNFLEFSGVALPVVDNVPVSNRDRVCVRIFIEMSVRAL